MTDRELIDYLSGQVTALTSFCGAMAKAQIDSKVLSRQLFGVYEQFGEVAESWNVSDSWTAGLRQTQKELAVFLGES
jgi:hypothetical protein